MKILTIETPEATHIVAIPPAAREGTFPDGSKYLLVPAPPEDSDFADADGMLALDGEWLVNCARHGWAGLTLLETTAKAADTMSAP